MILTLSADFQKNPQSLPGFLYTGIPCGSIDNRIKIHWNSTENQCNSSLEIHRKPNENPLGIHWKSFENPSRFHWNPNETQRTFMQQFIENLVKIHGKSIDISWKSNENPLRTRLETTRTPQKHPRTAKGPPRTTARFSEFGWIPTHSTDYSEMW